MKPDASIKDLGNLWRILAEKYTENVTLIHKLYGEIRAAYTSDDRHYHNLSHLSSLLSLSDRYARYLINKDLVDFAIFYHDIIYNVSQPDNEERSAEIAKERLTKLLVPEEKKSAVIEHILDSKTHIVVDNENRTDRRWFLDFDMSILGTEWERYFQYSQQIRKEYRTYPDVIYNAGRQKFLQKTLSMKSIFHTTEFRKQFEQQARRNLQKELDILHTV